METEAAKWGLEQIMQYGVVGIGWPIAAYLFRQVMREKDGRREDQTALLQKFYDVQADATGTLNRLVTLLETKR